MLFETPVLALINNATASMSRITASKSLSESERIDAVIVPVNLRATFSGFADSCPAINQLGEVPAALPGSILVDCTRKAYDEPDDSESI